MRSAAASAAASPHAAAAHSYGNAPSADNAPVAEGVLDDLARRQQPPSLALTAPRPLAQVGRPLFLALYDYFLAKGGVYKLAFGARPRRACARRRAEARRGQAPRRS